MERIFGSSRYLVMITIVVSLLSALVLYAVACTVLVNILQDTWTAVPAGGDAGKAVAVRLLKVLDILLIAVTFQIIAVGLYRLFINRSAELDSQSDLPTGRLPITTFHQLKSAVIHLAVVILVIQFLEQVVTVGPVIETFFFGAGIAIFIAAAIWAADRISAGH